MREIGELSQVFLELSKGETLEFDDGVRRVIKGERLFDVFKDGRSMSSVVFPNVWKLPAVIVEDKLIEEKL